MGKTAQADGQTAQERCEEGALVEAQSLGTLEALLGLGLDLGAEVSAALPVLISRWRPIEEGSAGG